MGTVNRRGFLAAALGALAYDPERALWTPGKKLISIPRTSPGECLVILPPDFVFAYHQKYLRFHRGTFALTCLRP
jgi:hypothetical protein